LNQPQTNFQTSDRYASASFTYRFIANEVTAGMDDDAREQTSEILKIDLSRIERRTDYSPEPTLTTTFNTGSPTSTTTSAGGLGVKRGLAGTVTIDYLIHPDIDSEDEKSPLQYANSLLDYRVELKQRIASFDESFFILGEDIRAVGPQFKTTPTFQSISETGELVIGNVQMQSTGTVYTCVLEKAGESQSLTSYQVVNGLNENNYPCQFKASVTDPSITGLLTVNGLAQITEYVAFVSATNSVQGNPDILPDSEVVIVRFSSAVLDVDEDDDDWSLILALAVLLITI
jgi:hypothetical protein